MSPMIGCQFVFPGCHGIVIQQLVCADGLWGNSGVKLSS